MLQLSAIAWALAAVDGCGAPVATPGGTCNVDGKTYPDGAGGIPASDDCNSCTCTNGSLVCTMHPCPARVCGARAGATCTANEYCAYEGDYCGAADATALCKVRPEICTEEFVPVCGCDSQTYPNACFAAQAGVGYSHTGTCENADGSCVLNGVTYAPGAGPIPAGDGCNSCNCSAGRLLCTQMACGGPLP